MTAASRQPQLHRELNRELRRLFRARCSREFTIQFSMELTVIDDRSAERQHREYLRDVIFPNA